MNELIGPVEQLLPHSLNENHMKYNDEDEREEENFNFIVKMDSLWTGRNFFNSTDLQSCQWLWFSF